MPRRNSGPHLDWLEKRRCYYIVWTERGRSRQRSTRTADRQEAEAELAKFIQSHQRHNGPRDPNEVLVTEVLTAYAEARAPHVQAAERISYAIPPLVGYWQELTVGQITEQSCDDYVKQRDRSNSTARRELGILRAGIRWAAENSRLMRQVSVHLPAESNPRERWLTRTEAAMLLAGALGFTPVSYDVRTRQPDRWQRIARPQYHLAQFIVLGLYTGRRMEAILSLQWRAIDFRTGWIDFRRPGQAETKKRRGRCRIPDRLLPHIERAARFGCDVGPVISWHGKPVRNVKKAFEAAASRVYLDDVSAHTLKHTAISWAMQSGEEPWQVADFFATSLATILKVYGHHHPEQQAAVASRIGRRPRNVRVTGSN